MPPRTERSASRHRARNFAAVAAYESAGLEASVSTSEEYAATVAIALLHRVRAVAGDLMQAARAGNGRRRKGCLRLAEASKLPSFSFRATIACAAGGFARARGGYNCCGFRNEADKR